MSTREQDIDGLGSAALAFHIRRKEGSKFYENLDTDQCADFDYIEGYRDGAKAHQFDHPAITNLINVLTEAVLACETNNSTVSSAFLREVIGEFQDAKCGFICNHCGQHGPQQLCEDCAKEILAQANQSKGK